MATPGWLVWRSFLVGSLLLALATPLPAGGAPASLGTAYGTRAVELSLDDGRSWLPLGSQSLPLLSGSRLRSTSGVARLDLGDGSRLNVLPFSGVVIRESEIALQYGRLTFRLPAGSALVVQTPTTRLEPLGRDAMVGEVFAGSDGTLGVRMAQGSLRVRELGGEKRVMVAASEPVFVPKRPEMAQALFTGDAPAAPPAGAKAVFGPSGESLGYLRPDGQLVIHGGFTKDLTRPFSPKLVQLALARVPEADRGDAMPVFDVNGNYVGYLAGARFERAEGTGASSPTAATSGFSSKALIMGGAAVGALGGIAAAASSGGGGSSSQSEGTASSTTLEGRKKPCPAGPPVDPPAATPRRPNGTGNAGPFGPCGPP